MRDKSAASQAKQEKKKKKPGFLYRLIMTLLILIMLVSAYNLGKILYKYWQSRHTYNEITKTAQISDDFDGNVDFDALREVNPDICAWIYQKDSIINYPVVKGTDNDKYLHTLFNGKWGVSGTLFVDYRNADNFQDFNTIIYGHHMKDGSMFKSLRNYREDNYYDEHKTFELITPEGKYHLEIVAYYVTPSDSDTYTMKFGSDIQKENFVAKAKQKSEITTDVNATAKDHLVTLSTCAYDYDQARYVVVTKMVPWSKAELDKAAKSKAAKEAAQSKKNK